MLEVHTDGQLYIDSYSVGKVEDVYIRSVDEELSIYQEALEAIDLFVRRFNNGKIEFSETMKQFENVLSNAGWYD